MGAALTCSHSITPLLFRKIFEYGFVALLTPRRLQIGIWRSKNRFFLMGQAPPDPHSLRAPLRTYITPVKYCTHAYNYTKYNSITAETQKRIFSTGNSTKFARKLPNFYPFLHSKIPKKLKHLSVKGNKKELSVIMHIFNFV